MVLVAILGKFIVYKGWYIFDIGRISCSTVVQENAINYYSIRYFPIDILFFFKGATYNDQSFIKSQVYKKKCFYQCKIEKILKKLFFCITLSKCVYTNTMLQARWYFEKLSSGITLWANVWVCINIYWMHFS